MFSFALGRSISTASEGSLIVQEAGFEKDGKVVFVGEYRQRFIQEVVAD